MQFLTNLLNLHEMIHYSLPILQKGLKGLLMLLQKVIGHPFACCACGNRELHATQMMFCNSARRTKL
jgi:hypothetical protein